jgi:hypothetical protein
MRSAASAISAAALSALALALRSAGVSGLGSTLPSARSSDQPRAESKTTQLTHRMINNGSSQKLSDSGHLLAVALPTIMPPPSCSSTIALAGWQHPRRRRRPDQQRRIPKNRMRCGGACPQRTSWAAPSESNVASMSVNLRFAANCLPTFPYFSTRPVSQPASTSAAAHSLRFQKHAW